MEYKKCLVQLDEILKHLSDTELAKIPYEIREAISQQKDKQYIWKYDESKELNEQNINRKTIEILSYLNMKYLLNKEQKMLMEELHRINEEKLEKEKSQKFNSQDIFKKNIKNVDTEEKINNVNSESKIETSENYNNMQMIIKKEEKFYEKIIKIISNIFHKK